MRRLLPWLRGAWPQPAVGVLIVLLALLSLGDTWAHAYRVGMEPAVGALPLALVGLGAIVVAYRYPIHVRHQTQALLVTLVYYLLAVLVPPPWPPSRLASARSRVRRPACA